MEREEQKEQRQTLSQYTVNHIHSPLSSSDQLLLRGRSHTRCVDPPGSDTSTCTQPIVEVLPITKVQCYGQHS